MTATLETRAGTPLSTPPQHVHVGIVGAGFAGLGIAIRLRQAGEHDFVV